MKTEFLYIWLGPDARCHRIVDQAIESVSLPGLLADGWRPVRETPSAQGLILILLERESETSFGFGFNPK